MEQAAGWIAPIATMIAAVMTAANLGARVTGWGFVVFTAGSVAWAVVGAATGQANLLWQNIALTAINLAGIWRWLGREARYAEGAEEAATESAPAAAPSLFPGSLLAGGEIAGHEGQLGALVDAMVECDSGRIAYVVVRTGGVGGVGETLHALPWKMLRVTTDQAAADLDADALARLPAIDPEHWPERAPAM